MSDLERLNAMLGRPATVSEAWDALVAEDSRCPACGNPIDYCQGHGEIGDPEGFRLLAEHDAGNHRECHPEGCDEYERCVSCGERLTPADPAVTTLGPRCAKCWVR